MCVTNAGKSSAVCLHVILLSHSLFIFFRHSHSGDYSEETGYVYRASATPDYPTAPPYNPDYPPHQNPYAAEQYPTGL